MVEGFEGVVVGGMEGVPVRVDGRGMALRWPFWGASVVVKVVLCLARYGVP